MIGCGEFGIVWARPNDRWVIKMVRPNIPEAAERMKEATTLIKLQSVFTMNLTRIHIPRIQSFYGEKDGVFWQNFEKALNDAESDANTRTWAALVERVYPLPGELCGES